MTELKMNFKDMYVDQVCPLCWLHEDSQNQIMECEILKENWEDLKENINVKYEHIFGSLRQQIKAIDLFEKIWETRRTLLLKNEN